jgi:hypothetical protein
VLLCGLAAGLCGGCSDSKLNSFVVKLFEPKRTPQQQMLIAFASEDPDQRRVALAKVAKSKQRNSDWAIKGYITIALLDSDTQSRCVAVRALANSGDPRAVETLLKLLNYRDYPPQEVRPPEALCRWDATKALADLSVAGSVPAEQRDLARQTLINRLQRDVDRNVRIAAARGLSVYLHDDALTALIERLTDEDFAVVHQCEESLVRLTGRTFHCDALAWATWHEEHREDAFAHANEIPESRRPPYSNRFEKAAYDVKEFMRWLVPGRKEK